MIVNNLQLSDFRKFKKKELKFSPQQNIILGSNAAGKTNILESLFFLATGKSFRADSDTEMIAFEKDFCRVRGEIIQLSNNDKIELEIIATRGEVMGIKTQSKKYSINGVVKKMIDFVGNLKVVLFWPQDLELVTDSPSRRRNYLDFVLIQVDREYRRSLISYEKGLRQRNRVLEAIRDVGAHRQQLIFWDQLLIKSGQYLTKKREEYIEYINSIQNTVYSIQNYQLFYDKSVISRDRFDQYSEAEVASATTLVGPHRDDFQFSILNSQFSKEEGKNLSHFGSRGEQRLGILWLKMGELSFIEESTGEKPVLLLDDIFSELDHEHRRVIFDIIRNQQTILTTTDEHFIENKSLKELEVIKL